MVQSASDLENPECAYGALWWHPGDTQLKDGGMSRTVQRRTCPATRRTNWARRLIANLTPVDRIGTFFPYSQLVFRQTMRT
jgi:hypothetical protein